MLASLREDSRQRGGPRSRKPLPGARGSTRAPARAPDEGTGPSASRFRFSSFGSRPSDPLRFQQRDEFADIAILFLQQRGSHTPSTPRRASYGETGERARTDGSVSHSSKRKQTISSRFKPFLLNLNLSSYFFFLFSFLAKVKYLFNLEKLLHEFSKQKRGEK